LTLKGRLAGGFINLAEYPVGFAAGINFSPERSEGLTNFSDRGAEEYLGALPRGSLCNFN